VPHGEKYDPISKIISENVARLRKQHNYTGTDLATRCAEYGRSLTPPIESRLSFMIISKIETGARTVSVTEMALLAGALAVTPDVLMGLPPSDTTPETLTLEARVVALEEKMGRILE